MTTAHTIEVDKITFGVDPGSQDYSAVFAVEKVGWHWVPLPKPSLWRRLQAWLQGRELPTEELREKFAIVVSGDFLVLDGSVKATHIAIGGKTVFSDQEGLEVIAAREAAYL